MKANLLIAALLISLGSFAQKNGLELHYDFKSSNNPSVQDVSGNDYHAQLKNKAFIDQVGDFQVLNLGYENGYLDIGTQVGELIQDLSDFSVATYVLVDQTANLGNNGNFIWTFSNSNNILSDRNGCAFFSAKSQEYSISQSDYRDAKTIGENTPLSKQKWKHVVYTQSGNTGTIYIDGEIQTSAEIQLTPNELGKTAYNFLGRSPYRGDDYLKGLITDFRIYSKALDKKVINKLSKNLEALNGALDEYHARPKKFIATGNPLFRHKYTADPAPLVHDGKFYIYAGQDTGDGSGYNIPNWVVFSSEDMKTWYEYPIPLATSTFDWAVGNSAWASQVIERDGKFYWYVSTEHGSVPGKAIGVGVADSPTGPFKDALGKALITNNMTTEWTGISWDDIDPTVWIEDDGQAYLFWGNTQCYYAKLKDNMIELDGEIKTIDLPRFTEAPWIHKRDDWYYLSYAYEWPEKTAYAMSKSIEGPWEFKGILNELAGNSNTNHQGIVEFKGNWYFVYHNGGIGGSYLRAVCIDYLHYNDDGTIKRIQMTTEGVDQIK